MWLKGLERWLNGTNVRFSHLSVTCQSITFQLTEWHSFTLCLYNFFQEFGNGLLLLWQAFLQKIRTLTRHFCKILEYAISYIIFLKIHLNCWYRNKKKYSTGKFTILKLHRGRGLNSRPTKPALLAGSGHRSNNLAI